MRLTAEERKLLRDEIRDLYNKCGSIEAIKKYREVYRSTSLVEAAEEIRKMTIKDEERKEHALCSEMYLLAAEHLRVAKWHAISAALREYGDGDGRLISGVYREHFPSNVKDTLCDLNRDSNNLVSKSIIAWKIAGKRMRTWRRMRDRIQTICNMVAMYEGELGIKKVRK